MLVMQLGYGAVILLWYFFMAYPQKTAKNTCLADNLSLLVTVTCADAVPDAACGQISITHW